MDTLKEFGKRKNEEPKCRISSNFDDIDKDNFIDRIAFVFSKTCVTTDCQQITRAENDNLERIDN